MQLFYAKNLNKNIIVQLNGMFSVKSPPDGNGVAASAICCVVTLHIRATSGERHV